MANELEIPLRDYMTGPELGEFRQTVLEVEQAAALATQTLSQVAQSVQSARDPLSVALQAGGVVGTAVTSTSTAAAAGAAATAVVPAIAFGAFMLGQVVAAVVAALEPDPIYLDQYAKQLAWRVTGRTKMPLPGFEVPADGSKGGYAQWRENYLRYMYSLGQGYDGDLASLQTRLLSRAGYKKEGDGRWVHTDGFTIPSQQAAAQALLDKLIEDEKSYTGAQWQQQGSVGSYGENLMRRRSLEALFAVLWLVQNDDTRAKLFFDDNAAWWASRIGEKLRERATHDLKWAQAAPAIIAALDGRYEVTPDGGIIFYRGDWPVNGLPIRDWPVWVPMPWDVKKGLFGAMSVFPLMNLAREGVTIQQIQRAGLLDPRAGVVDYSVPFADMTLAQARAVVVNMHALATLATRGAQPEWGRLMELAEKAERQLKLCRAGTAGCDPGVSTVRGDEPDAAALRLAELALTEMPASAVAQQTHFVELGAASDQPEGEQKRDTTSAVMAAAVLVGIVYVAKRVLTARGYL